MRNVILLVFFISKFSIAGFTGHWVEEGETYSFKLDLMEQGNDLLGKYCFITNNGNRIDCPGDDEENIHGVINGGVAEVVFDSTFGGSGKATLSISNDIIHYSINDYAPFIEASMSVPETIIFKRVINKK